MNQDREPLPSRVEGLPELPPEVISQLDDGLRVLGLAGLPEGARTGLASQLRLLMAWNASINLSAIRDPSAAVGAHILDSLTAVGLLRERSVDALLDIGSGGGYPGVPLALCVPTRRSLLVESVAKKAAFLSAVAGVVSQPGTAEVDVFNGRAETLAADRRHRERWPAVLARAIAPLAELSELALPLVARGGLLIAWKRLPLDAELDAARGAIDALGGAPARLVNVELDGLTDHVLVVVEKVRASPGRYPRDPAARRRQPLGAGEGLPSV